MLTDQPGSETAATRGRRLADEFDSSLRSLEEEERERRLDELASQGLQPAFRVDDGGQLERLLAFHSAVQRSRVWRLAQVLRRPLGRAW